MRDNYAEQIKKMLTMQEVVDGYNLEVNRGGYITCPFHTERTPSLKIYPEDRGYHCFGCNSGGDVISFVQHYFDLNFAEAVVRLNYDFNLNLSIGGRMTAHERAKKRKEATKRAEQAKTAKAVREDEERRAWLLLSDWITSDIYRHKYAPTSPNEEFHPLFVEAIKSIDYQSYLIDLHT